MALLVISRVISGSSLFQKSFFPALETTGPTPFRSVLNNSLRSSCCETKGGLCALH